MVKWSTAPATRQWITPKFAQASELGDLMIQAEAGGFWSYAHEDDAADAGGILRLATRLAEEYSLVTGNALQLFVDRSSMEWGDLWRDRIDNALAQTTFFIPVITPRYFTRQECRRELLAFASQAESLGVVELVMPILYSTVAELNDVNKDEAVALISRCQYIDWRHIRLADDTSAEYRKALNKLALRLADIADRVKSKQLILENTTEASSEADLGTFDILEAITERWPELVELVEEDILRENLWVATWNTFSQRMARLEQTGRSGAKPVVLRRHGIECLPIARRHLELAQRYSAITIEIDPLIRSLYRKARESSDPAVTEALDEFETDIREVSARINRIESYTLDYLVEYARASKTMKEIYDLFRSSALYGDEGNRIIKEWEEEALLFRHDLEGRDSHAASTHDSGT